MIFLLPCSQVGCGRWHNSCSLVAHNRWQHKFQFFFRYLPVLIFIACFHKTGLDFLQTTGVIRFTLKKKKKGLYLVYRWNFISFHFHLFSWKEICELCLYSRLLMFISFVKLIKVRVRLIPPPPPPSSPQKKGAPTLLHILQKMPLVAHGFEKVRQKNYFA